MNRLQRAIHGERIEEKHGDKRLYTSQRAFTLTKGDLLTIHTLGEYKHITPAQMLQEYNVYILLQGIADNITDERFIEMLNLVEDERELTAKSNEYLGRSLGVRNIIHTNRGEWTRRLNRKTLVSRLSQQSTAILKELLQIPNKTLREAVEGELVRRNKKKVEDKNETRIHPFTGTDDITYDITPEARGLNKIGAIKYTKPRSK